MSRENLNFNLRAFVYRPRAKLEGRPLSPLLSLAPPSPPPSPPSLPSSSVAMAPPVQLRGLLRRRLGREILTAAALGIVAGAMWMYGVQLPRRKRYEDFYRNYDAKATAESMTASFERGGLYLES